MTVTQANEEVVVPSFERGKEDGPGLLCRGGWVGGWVGGLVGG